MPTSGAAVQDGDARAARGERARGRVRAARGARPGGRAHVDDARHGAQGRGPVQRPARVGLRHGLGRQVPAAARDPQRRHRQGLLPRGARALRQGEGATDEREQALLSCHGHRTIYLSDPPCCYPSC
ncbi:hypothetical protein ON010_g19021 [Phytophthora cinnamomi]|nr:hypothetical protein ON010_g19021 [Phytophthora cinnamomi]